MRDTLDLQELRERVNRYQAQKHRLRNRTLIFMLGALIIFAWIWTQPDIDPAIWNLSIAFFPLVMSLIPAYAYSTPLQKLSQDRSERAQKYLAHFLRHDEATEASDLPKSDEKSEQPKHNVYTMITVALIVSVSAAFPWVIIYLIMSSFLIITIMKFPVQYMRLGNLDEQHKRYLRQVFRNRVMIVLGLLCFNWIVLAIVGQFVNNLQRDFYLDSLLYLTTLVPLFFIELNVFNIWYQRTYYYNPLRDGKYDALLGEISLVSDFSRDMGVLYWQALVKQFKGESASAEAIWRELLELLKVSGQVQMIAIALTNIGYTLKAQNQTEAALEYFEASIRLCPDMAGVYRGLIEYYNKLEVHPDRALEIAQFMLSIARKPRWNIMFNFSEWANTLSTMAVAYANMGDLTQGKAYIEQAFDQGDHRFKSNLAGIHNTAGYICKLEGDLDTARDHYQQAMQIDPNGITARYAHEALAELAV